MNKIFLPLPVQNSNSLPAGCQTHGPKLIAVAAGLFLAFFASTGTAQNTQLPTRSRVTENAKARLVSSPAPVLPAPATPSPDILMPPSRPTAEQLPLSAPQVSYAEGQLTITAENSTLTDIMTAIRVQMGADVELPPSASREHMVVRLGPGPAREVIASLLSWTDYDYVIQASDSDPAGVRSVLVTSRTKTGAGSASANLQMAQRYPRGRAGEMASAPAEEPADDPVPLAPDTAAETAAAQQVPQPATQSEAADQQTAVAETQPAAATTVRKSDLANTMTAADTAALEAQAAALAQQVQPPAQDSASNDAQSKTPEMIQQLQRMYQQRVQMQKTPPPSN